MNSTNISQNVHKFSLTPCPLLLPESPRLSTASISSNERAPSATPSDCSDFPSAGQRPVSLVSTLSSGSGSSRDDSPAPPPPGGTVPPTGDDIDLELNPPVGVGDQDRQHLDTADPSGEGLVSRGGKFDQLNNNNTATPSRAASTRHTPPLSPFAAITMAPNPKITYLDRVVMEIIETERMYVRDLRSIVEVRDKVFSLLLKRSHALHSQIDLGICCFACTVAVKCLYCKRAQSKCCLYRICHYPSIHHWWSNHNSSVYSE